MRKSVNYKFKYAMTATMVVLIMLLTVILGLLAYSPLGNVVATDNLAQPAAAVTENTYSAFTLNPTSGNVDSEKTTGTRITDGAGLQSFLSSATSGSVGYLAENITDFNPSNYGSTVDFKGTLYGNGKTVTITSTKSVSDEMQSARGTNNCHSMGLFVARNSGVIQDLHVNYDSTFWSRPTDEGDSVLGGSNFGVICGENAGTIQNISLSMTNADVQLYYSTGDFNGRTLIVGGICGVQNGVLNNVYVQMSNTILSSNARKRKYTTGGQGYAHVAITGGVYGMYNGATAAANTSNLMMKGDSTCKIVAKNEAADSGWSTSSGYIAMRGAVAGYSIQDVKGVIWDYQGEFSGDYESGSFGNWTQSYYEKGQTAATVGIPDGYFFAGPVRSDNATADKAVYPSMWQPAKYEAKYDFYPFGINDGGGLSIPWGSGGPDKSGARGYTEKNNPLFDIRKYGDYYDSPVDSLGKINLSFTNTKGEIKLSKTIADNNNDVFFNVSTQYTNFEGPQDIKIQDYSAANNKVLNANFGISTNTGNGVKITIETGKKFGRMRFHNTTVDYPYFGNNFWDRYAVRAFYNTTDTDALRTYLGSVPTINMNQVTILDNQNKGSTFGKSTFDYPANRSYFVKLQSTLTEKELAYVDIQNRFYYESCAFQLNINHSNYTVEAIDATWQQAKKITVSMNGGPGLSEFNTGNSSILDHVGYRMKGAETFTNAGIYDVSYDVTTNTYKFSFDINENSTDAINGNTFEFFGYTATGKAVVFNGYANSAEVPVEISGIKVDNVNPVLEEAPFAVLNQQNKWFYENQIITSEFSDINSGVVRYQLWSRAAGTQDAWGENSSGATNNTATHNFTFEEYKQYKLQVFDKAGNPSNEVIFTAQIDKTRITINGLEYFTDRNCTEGSEYTPGVQHSTSVYVKVNLTAGPAGGIISFESATNTANNTHDRIAIPANATSVVLEIKRAVDREDETGRQGVVFSLKPETNAEYNNGTKPDFVATDTAIIFVDRLVIDFLINDFAVRSLDGTGLTMPYAATSDYSAAFGGATLNNLIQLAFDADRKNAVNDALATLTGEYQNKYNADSFLSYLTVHSAKFYYDDKGTQEVTDANEGTTDLYYLIIEIRANSEVPFAIRNEQFANNKYVFKAGDVRKVYTDKTTPKEVTLGAVGINKKVLKSNTQISGSKTYWQTNKMSVFNTKDTFFDGLMAGDSVVDAIEYDYKDLTQESNAGHYVISANLNHKNYKFADAKKVTYTINKYQITKITIKNRKESYNAQETPRITASYIGARGIPVSLEVIYKNLDHEVVHFYPGKVATAGEYNYVILLDDETLRNNINVSDPNELIGTFNVVQIKPEEGVNFHFMDADDKKAGVQIVYTNGIIDFKNYIEFDDVNLREEMFVLYGLDESETSNMMEVGSYWINLVTGSGTNNIYGSWSSLPFQVEVVSANVNVPNGAVQDKNVTFANSEFGYGLDDISQLLKDRLAKYAPTGDIVNDFNFNWTYRQSNGTLLPVGKLPKDVDNYSVKLSITGKKNEIVPISLDTTLTINVNNFTLDWSHSSADAILTNVNGIATYTTTFVGIGEYVTIGWNNMAELEGLLAGSSVTLTLPTTLQFDQVATGFTDYYRCVVTLNTPIGAKENVKIVNPEIHVVIQQLEISLEGTYNINIDPNNEGTFGGMYNPANGQTTLRLADVDIETLSKYDKTLSDVVFNLSAYKSTDIVTLGDNGGVLVYNAGHYEIPVTLVADNNLRLGSGAFIITIGQKEIALGNFTDAIENQDVINGQKTYDGNAVYCGLDDLLAGWAGFNIDPYNDFVFSKADATCPDFEIVKDVDAGKLGIRIVNAGKYNINVTLKDNTDGAKNFKITGGNIRLEVTQKDINLSINKTLAYNGQDQITWLSEEGFEAGFEVYNKLRDDLTFAVDGIGNATDYKFVNGEDYGKASYDYGINTRNAGTYKFVVGLRMNSLGARNFKLIGNKIAIEVKQCAVDLSTLGNIDEVFNNTSQTVWLPHDTWKSTGYSLRDDLVFTPTGIGTAKDFVTSVKDEYGIGFSATNAGTYRATISLKAGSLGARNFKLIGVDGKAPVVEVKITPYAIDVNSSIIRPDNTVYSGNPIELLLNSELFEAWTKLGIDPYTDFEFVRQSGSATGDESVSESGKVGMSVTFAGNYKWKLILKSDSEVARNITLTNATIALTISEMPLTLNFINVGGVEYSGSAIEVILTPETLAELIALGIKPYTDLEFKLISGNANGYNDVNVEDKGKIGISVINVGDYRVRVSFKAGTNTARNFKVENSILSFAVNKIALDLGFAAQMNDVFNGSNIETLLDSNSFDQWKTLGIDPYKDFVFVLSENMSGNLIKDEAANRLGFFVRNAGTYKIKVQFRAGDAEFDKLISNLQISNGNITYVVAKKQIVLDNINQTRDFNGDAIEYAIDKSLWADTGYDLEKDIVFNRMTGNTANFVVLPNNLGIAMTNAGTYNLQVAIASGTYGAENFEIVGGKIAVVINKAVVNLTFEDKYEWTYNPAETVVWLTKEDIDTLVKLGATPFVEPLDANKPGKNTLYFELTAEHKNKGIHAIREEKNNKIGLAFRNIGEFEITVRMLKASSNFQIAENTTINVVIAKREITDSELGFFMNYNLADGSPKTANIARGEDAFTMTYNGYAIQFDISAEGKKLLNGLGLNYVIEINGQQNDTFVNSGEYTVTLKISNNNVKFENLTKSVVIDKVMMGEIIGKLDVEDWLIDGEKPTDEDLEYGLMYKKDAAGVEAVYSLRLSDHDQLVAEGFSIRYLYDGAEVEGVSKAGYHNVEAVITRTDNPDNWETRVVKLWQLDKNGNFVLNPDTGEKQLLSSGFTIAKSEALQEEIDSLTELALQDVTAEYDGKPHSLDFTDAQKAKLDEMGITYLMRKNEFINAGEYTILVTFDKLIEGTSDVDTNYVTAEMEATLTISQKQVVIQYEFADKKKDKNGFYIFGEGEKVEVRAYYVDLYGQKVYIESFTTEIISGKDGEYDFSAPGKDDKGNVEYKPNNYQITSNIADSNYAYDEENAANFFRFKIKNETKAKNTTAYWILGLAFLAVVAFGIIALYVFRLFNPACQEIDLGGDDDDDEV